MTIEKPLIERLVDIYFGEDLQEYTQLLNKILSCQKLEDFKKLELLFDSSALAEVFERATKEQLTASEVRPARYGAIFKQVKAVQTSTDFI